MPEIDTTETARRHLIDSGQTFSDLAEAERNGEQTWDTIELQEQFTVIGFAAPFVVVRRKSDDAVGTLEFTGRPRRYFGWQKTEG